MDDTDEDFGDLYADVEVQAISSISYIPNLYIEQVDINAKPSDSIAEKLGSVGDDESKRNSSSEANCENVSDSEDDLNIVLNEDDNGAAFPNSRFDDDELEEGSGDLGGVGEGNGLRKNRKWVDQVQLGDGLEQSSNGVGGSEKGNGAKGGYHSQYSQYKYIRPHAAASPRNSKVNGSVGVASLSSAFSRGDWEDIGSNQLMGSSSIFAQSGYNFSLPRNKTILDVNIDTLERKPWRHPGIDITAFFNFGFDEESWKDYCNRLEQCRLQTSMSAARIPVYEHAKLSEPKGRAIQVEDSTSERRPSFDVNRQLDRVSDVVIQIPLQDSLEESSGSDKDKVGHIYSPVREASENGDFGVADATDIHCSGSVSGDELLDGNVERLDTRVPKRCSQQTTPSDPLSPDSDSHGSGQIADVNGPDQKITVYNSEGKSEVVETSNNTREEIDKDKSNIAPSNMEIESSLGEQSQHSHLSLSCSGSHSEAPHDDAYIDTEKIHNRTRSSPNSAGELRESVTSDYYHANDSKSRDVKTKPRDFEYYSRNRNHTQDDRRQYSRRLHSESKFKRHSKDDGASPIWGTEGHYEFDHSRIDHNSNSHNREHLSYYRDSELSFNYRRESFYDNQVQTAYSKNLHRKGCHRFGDETERFSSRKDGGDYFLEDRVPRVNGEVMERDWYRYRRGPVVDDMDTLPCRDSRRLVSERSSYLKKKERGTRWGGKGDELHCRQRMGNDDFFVECNYTDDFIREKYGRSVPPNDMEIDYHNNKYDRHLPYTRRDFENSSRGERTYDIPSSNLENLWSRGDEDECRSLSSRSYKELHAVNVGRWPDTMPPRNDMHGLRKPKRHASHKTEIWTDRYRDSNWLGSYHDTFDMEENIGYPNHQDHFEQRRHHWHSENEYFSRNRDDEVLAGDESFSFRRTSSSRHSGFHAKHGPDNVPKLINDRQVPQHRYKRVREGKSEGHIDRGSNVTHRDNHEQTHLKCGNSVDLHLVVGEGKSSGRSSAAGSLMRNGRIENMDSNIDKRVIFNDCDEPHLEKVRKADYPEVEKSQNDEKWHDKYPVTRQNEALDIEEGQIITEDFNENLMEKDEINDVKERIVGNENAMDGNKVVKENNNPRILEMIAKMEKRRERFKEPITVNKESDANPKALVDQVVETAEAKQERPARKRRWGGN